MVLEIRLVGPDDAVGWVRVLPQYTGRPMWEPLEAAWHAGPEPWSAPVAVPVEQAAGVLDDPEVHAVAAVVDGRVVGASEMTSHEVTVPGLRPLAMGGVGSTGVLVTHRRRGLLRQMMQHMFDGASVRGEALAMLSASEGSIYGHFGFAPATDRVRWELEQHRAVFRAPSESTGRVDVTDAAEAREVWPALHEAVRLRTVGELAARPGRWSGLSDEAVGTDGPPQYLVHRPSGGSVDGVVRFRQPWGRSVEEAGTVVVDGLVATTEQAYRALWEVVLSVDLTRRVVAAGRPADEPLRWLLTDPRAMRVTRSSDNLWARLLDVPAALVQRGYPHADTLVLAVDDDQMCTLNNGSWRLETDGALATCERTRASPDVTVEVSALSRLYLGGGSARLLAAAGRIREHREGALGRLGRLLRTDPPPHNSFGF